MSKENVYPSVMILIWSISLSFGLLLRLFCGSYQKYLPLKGIVGVVTVVVAASAAYLPQLQPLVTGHIPFAPKYLMAVAYPIYVIRVFYKCDLYFLIRYLPLVYFLGLVALVLGYILLGQGINLMADEPLLQYQTIIHGAVFIPTPPNTLAWMVDERKVSDIYSVLEVMAIMSYMKCALATEISLGVAEGALTEWYHYFATMARLFFGGMLLGYTIGLLSSTLTRFQNRDVITCIVFNISLAYLSYFLASVLSLSPEIAVILLAAVSLSNKKHYTHKTKIILALAYEITDYIVDFIVFIYCVYLITITTINYEPYVPYKLLFYDYFVSLIAKTFWILCVYTILKKYMRVLTIKMCILVIFSLIISTMNMVFALMYYYNRATHAFGKNMLIEVLFCTILSQLINNGTIYLCMKSSTLDFNMIQISNMHNCLLYINDNRMKFVRMMQNTKILGDVHWDIVIQDTLLKHPYFKDYNQHTPSEHFVHFVQKRAICPSCSREVAAQMTTKAVNTLRRDLREKFISELKVNLARRKHLGMITYECSALLMRCLEVDEKNIKGFRIDLQELKLFFKQNPFLNWVIAHSEIWVQRDIFNATKPRKPWRQVCYKIITNKYYQRTTYVLIPGYCIALVFIIFKEDYLKLHQIVLVLNVFYFIYFVAEFFCIIQAYSFEKFSDGKKLYFSSTWNWLDMVALIILVFEITIEVLFLYIPLQLIELELWPCYMYARIFRVIRLIRLLKTQIPRMLQGFSELVKLRNSLGFQMATTLKDSYDEIFLNFNTIIMGYEQLSSDLLKDMLTDRDEVFEIMMSLQKTKSSVVRTVRTDQVINSAIRELCLHLEDFRSSGFLDLHEYNMIGIEITNAEKKAKSIKKIVTPCWNHVIPWMVDFENFVELINRHATKLSFLQNEVIIDNGVTNNNIYILLSGLLKLFYEADTSAHVSGFLPVVDYAQHCKFDTNIHDVIVPGNSFGELACLTERRSCCKITCWADSQVLVIPQKLVYEGFFMYPHPIYGLEATMWKWITMEVATAVLCSTQLYESYTRLNVRLKLEHGVVPSFGIGYKYLNRTNLVQDLIILDGIAVSKATSQIYRAPAYIPRSVRKLRVFNPVTKISDEFYEAKFLAIPTPGYTFQGIKFNPETLTIELTDDPNDLLPAVEKESIVQQQLPPQSLKQRRLTQTVYMGN